MGDIVKKIHICGLSTAGAKSGCATIDALIDTGATQTVVSEALAARLGGALLPYPTHIEDQPIPQHLAAIELKAKGCRPNVVTVAVDDVLVRKAGRGPDGAPLQAILGHDYLQKERGALRYAKGGRSEAGCDVASFKKRRR